MRNAARFIGLTVMVGMLAMGTSACRDTSHNEDDDMMVPDGGHVDGDGSVIPDGNVGGTVTIYDVQNETMPEGTAITLENVVVTAVDMFGARVGSIYVQELDGGPFSGVFVFAPQGAGSLKVGDLITVTGGVKQEFICPITQCSTQDTTGRKLTEISPPQGGTIVVTKTGTGTLPTPPVVDPVAIMTDDAEAEKWEGVPVTLSNVTVLSAPKVVSTSATADATFQQMSVTGPIQVQSSMVALSKDGTAFAKGDCFGSITGIVDYFFDYHLQPRSEDDYVTAGVNCTVEATATHIQDGTIGPNTPVKLTGVVVTAVAKFKNAGSTAEEHRVWVADSATAAPLNGVLVFKATISGTNNATIDNLVPGDIVDVNGLTAEFFTETQIAGNASIPVTIERTGTGPAPTPVVVPLATLLSAATAEAYEGVLVKVENVKVVSTNPDLGGTPPDVGEWSVGTAGSALRVDDVMFKRPTDLAVGQCKSVTGPLDFSFSNYKLQPRGLADVPAGTCP